MWSFLDAGEGDRRVAVAEPYSDRRVGAAQIHAGEEVLDLAAVEARVRAPEGVRHRRSRDRQGMLEKLGFGWGSLSS